MKSVCKLLGVPAVSHSMLACLSAWSNVYIPVQISDVLLSFSSNVGPNFLPIFLIFRVAQVSWGSISDRLNTV